MTDYRMLTDLLGLPNVTAVSYQFVTAARIEVHIESSLDTAVCPDCQRISTQHHDTAEPQALRDLSIWDRQCWLRYAFDGHGALPAPPALVRLSNGWPAANPAWRTRCAMPSTVTNARGIRIWPRLRKMKV